MTGQLPQYGELATPEEQRRAAGLPPLGQDAAESSMPSAAPTAPAAAAPARRRPVDRIITIALLAYGLVNVIVTAVSYLDLPTAMNETMKILGIDGEFTNFAQGRLWGTFAVVVLVVGWALTALLSVRRLRRGKLTWWVPVVGAVATTIMVSICIMVPMLGDPAFMAYVESMAKP